MHSPLRQHPGLYLRAVVSPGDWAVLADGDPWKGHVLLVLGPVCEGRFEGLQKIMHPGGSTYHVLREALELSEHGPAAIPKAMHFPLRQLPLVGLERLRLCAVVYEVPKAASEEVAARGASAAVEGAAKRSWASERQFFVSLWQCPTQIGGRPRRTTARAANRGNRKPATEEPFSSATTGRSTNTKHTTSKKERPTGA